MVAWLALAVALFALLVGLAAIAGIDADRKWRARDNHPSGTGSRIPTMDRPDDPYVLARRIFGPTDTFESAYVTDDGDLFVTFDLGLVIEVRHTEHGPSFRKV